MVLGVSQLTHNLLRSLCAWFWLPGSMINNILNTLVSMVVIDKHFFVLLLFAAIKCNLWVAYIMCDHWCWCWIWILNIECMTHNTMQFPPPLSFLLNVVIFSLPPSCSTQHWPMFRHPQDLEEASEEPHAPLQIDFVHVGGRYRVGKLLGFGGSGKPSSSSSSPLYWYLSRKCLPRERYQDMSWRCTEDRGCRPVTFKAQSWIQCV